VESQGAGWNRRARAYECDGGGRTPQCAVGAVQAWAAALAFSSSPRNLRILFPASYGSSISRKAQRPKTPWLLMAATYSVRAAVTLSFFFSLPRKQRGR